jgi:hypothetical protein
VRWWRKVGIKDRACRVRSSAVCARARATTQGLSRFCRRLIAPRYARLRPRQGCIKITNRLQTQFPIPTIQEQQPSPTEPNTPSEDETAGSGTQDSSAERKSFSSLINYDPSSQQTNLVTKSIPRAEMLRLRLKVAMYKVRTNQVDVPFDKLQVDDRPVKPTSQAVEEAVAQLRKEAQEALARQQSRTQSQGPVSVPKLQPGPILRPTAYSTRMLYEAQIPSSPPNQRSPGGRSPARSLAEDCGTPQRVVRMEEAELTSSIVKGKVAEGLLGLRNAV